MNPINVRHAAGVATGVTLATAVIGPALAPGALFLLDSTVVDVADLGSASFGLGPEVPRAVPYNTVIRLVGKLIGADVAEKAAVLLSLTGAFVGMYRLLRHHPIGAALAGATLFAVNPFVLTRVLVGHWSMVAAYAALPWVVSSLATATSDKRRYVAMLAIGATGAFGGLLGWLLVAAYLFAERQRPRLQTIAAVLAASMVWLLPSGLVLLSGTNLASADGFAAPDAGVGYFASLLAGGGFWQDAFQVGDSLPIILVGLVLAPVALVGARQLPFPWTRTVTWLAAASVLISIIPQVPGIDSTFDRLTSTIIGAPFREPQRFLSLYLLWLCPHAIVGFAALAERVGRLREVAGIAPIACAAMFLGPGIWGVGGSLSVVDVPPEWQEARSAVRERPGVVLALPWERYLRIDFAQAQRSLNPAPRLLGVDVMTSSDLALAAGSTERADPRQDEVAAIVDAMLRGEDTASRLRDAGVRWLLIMHEADYEDYLPAAIGLGIEPTVIGRSLELYELPEWTGHGATADGSPVTVSPGFGTGPRARADSERSFTWNRAYQWGWFRGTSAASESPDGRIRVPAGAGPIWFAPGFVVVLYQLAAALAAVVALLSMRTRLT